MKRVFIPIAACWLILSAVTACTEKEKKDRDAPPPPPPPTAQEIASEIRRASLNSLSALIAGPDQPVPASVYEQVLTGLRSGKAKHQGSKNGKEALDMIAVECNQILSRAVETESWHAVLLACDALDIVEPDNVRANRLRERARGRINRPKVTIKGFFTDAETDETKVFLDVYLPETKKTEKVRAHVGQEFYGLRLVDIIGKEKGIKMQHIETGEMFDVRWKR